MAASAFFTTLSHEGLLAVRGVDASKFLQGQLTCNLDYLDAEHASLGARCNIKGRMQSSFRILQQADGYLLAMASELLAAQLADLQKYAVFSKSKLTDESPAWVRFGVQASDAVIGALGLPLPADGAPANERDLSEVTRQGDILTIRVSPGRYELWAPAEQTDSLVAQLSAQLPVAPLNDWLLGQVRAGEGQVFGSTRELFIPQMINLQAVGGVSFKKGCYTGQEIVARMQYLGKLKRRLYRLESAVNELPVPGTELFSPVHASSVGEVVIAAHTPDGIELLAVLQDNAREDGRIHLASSDGQALKLLDIPYALDSNREIQR